MPVSVQSKSTTNLVSSLLLGVSSGILSQTGIASVIQTTPTERLPGFLRSSGIRRGTAVGAVFEMVANATLPFLPARSSAAGLPGRVVAGASSAGVNAAANAADPKVAALVGGTSAAVSAIVITKVRAMLAKHLPDPLVAVGEAIVAVALAVAAIRKTSRA